MKGVRIRTEQNELENCVVTGGEYLCSGISALVVLIVIITSAINTTTTIIIILLLKCSPFLHPSYSVFTKLYSSFNNLLRNNPNRCMQDFANFSLFKKLWIMFTEHLYIILQPRMQR
jgi:hypothetical protein